jgi:hypothetical protein
MGHPTALKQAFVFVTDLHPSLSVMLGWTFRPRPCPLWAEFTLALWGGG